MSKKVLKAVLFDGFHHPTLGNLKPTFPQDDKSLKDFEMTLEDNGTLFVQWSGGTVLGRPTPAGAFSIGVSNIKVLVHPYEGKSAPVSASKPETKPAAPRNRALKALPSAAPSEPKTEASKAE